MKRFVFTYIRVMARGVKIAHTHTRALLRGRARATLQGGLFATELSHGRACKLSLALRLLPLVPLSLSLLFFCRVRAQWEAASCGAAPCAKLRMKGLNSNLEISPWLCHRWFNGRMLVIRFLYSKIYLSSVIIQITYGKVNMIRKKVRFSAMRTLKVTMATMHCSYVTSCSSFHPRCRPFA